MNKYIASLLLSATSVISAGAIQLSLEDCLELAMENNHKLKNSALEFDASVLTQKEAFTAYFPVVYGTGIYYNANKGMAKAELDFSYLLPGLSFPFSILKSGTVASVAAVQPIFLGGRVITGNKLARIGKDVAEIQVKLAVNDVKSNINEYFWEIHALEEKITTLDYIDSLLDRLRKDVLVAVEAGVRMKNDLLRVELQQQEIESNRLKLRNGIKVYKMLLAQYIGLKSYDIELSMDDIDDLPEPHVYFVDPFIAAENRYEKKLVDSKIEASRLNIKLKSGERLPSLGVGAGYVYNDLLGTSNNNGIIFGTASIPISDWWSGSYAVKREKIRLRQAENEKQDVMELLVVEISDKWNRFYESYYLIKLAEKSIDSAFENLRLNDNYYRAGTVSVSDVLEAQFLYRQALEEYIDCVSSYHINKQNYLIVTAP
ncbi:MAG: TolC family protein [Rikenellaceae bacterium]|nr:TolC family protein [Rikenellaceae bacterium]